MAKVKTIWNMNDVKVIVNEIEQRTGEKLRLEVKVNGKLKKALARCLTRVINGKHIPTKLEFGNTILNVSDHEIFKQIVLHEIAHAIANRRYQDNCNHDSRFKKVCAEIGCTNTGAYCSTEYALALHVAHMKVQEQKEQQATTTTTKRQTTKDGLTKYSVICRKCGNVHPRKQLNQTLKDIIANKGYSGCGKCGSTDLYVQQNW